ncbi:venom serine carboxypeptidase-like [Copidosoma floridanum]|uniref:venom serine carboxypeptidase-like n=1 Tax=Copidosoma floridanum TaxID=29053 RepID=UPI0006C9413D|nr:venom serine carboxypeptidase-like [Copidosoma floridanum]
MTPSNLLVLFLVYYLVCSGAFAVNNNEVELDASEKSEAEDVGKPLILSHYLDNGQLKEGREKALVEHREIPGIESYSGYFTVNKEYNANLFFWYCPAENNRESAPIVLWMTGGPGSTSMLGLFAENGPFTVTANQTVEMRKHSWTRNHHMLYLDSPVDAGYSFTESDKGFATTSDDVARDALAFLTQFFQLFPELRSNELYVVGESLAGKFAPPIAHAIKVHNENAEVRINVQGLIIAGGVCDLVNQVKHVQYIYELGLIGEDDRRELQALEDKLVGLLKQKKVFQSIALMNKVNKMMDNITGYSYYFHSMRPTEPDYINPFVHWVVRPDVRKAIHVGNVTFERTSVQVKKHIGRDMLHSVANYVEEALADGKKVLVYVGQLDMMVTNAAMENYISKLKWPGAESYKTTKRKIYYVGDELAGYVRSGVNLTAVLMRNSGHMLPNDQPVLAFDMITRFTHNLGY